MQTLPRLRKDLLLYSAGEDGAAASEVVLKDPTNERFVRLDILEHRFLAQLDGTRTLEQARLALQDQGRCLSSEEASQLALRAEDLGLLMGTRYSTAAHQEQLRERAEQAKNARGLSRLFFFYVPLVNPDHFLEKTLWIYRLVVNRWTAVAMMILTPGALFIGLTNFPRVEREYLFFFHWKGMAFLWVTLIVMKIVHEMAHAYCAKNYGLRVPQIGMAVMIFWPFLYCDTTHVWQLPSRGQRIAVSAAGVVVETVLAVLATWIWGFSRPGIVNSLAFYVMAVSLLSTMLVNANPLMKRDGYFVLIDLVNIPNLAKKSAEELRHAFLNKVLGVESVRSPASSPGEAGLFLFYGVTSFLYRILLSFGIIGVVYFQFDKMLGAMLACLALVSFAVLPASQAIGGLIKRRSEIRPRARGMVAFVILSGVGIATLTLPLTTRSVYPCFVIASRRQDLSLPLQIRVTESRVREGSPVREGELLFALDARELELALVQKQLERDILQREYELTLLDPRERGRAPIKAVEVFRIEDEIAHVRAKLAQANAGVRAPFDGVVTRLDPRMQAGFRPGEGTIVGKVEAMTDLEIHALIPAEDRHRMQVGQEVQIWLPLQDAPRREGHVTEVRSYSESDLKDSPFSSTMGGELATERRDLGHKETPLEAHYVCVVRASRAPLPRHAGMTGRMAVPRPPRSLYRIMVDSLVQTFNRESVI